MVYAWACRRCGNLYGQKATKCRSCGTNAFQPITAEQARDVAPETVNVRSVDPEELPSVPQHVLNAASSADSNDTTRSASGAEIDSDGGSPVRTLLRLFAALLVISFVVVLVAVLIVY